jgi:hypothetical protein
MGNEDKHKHLDLVSQAIGRMGQNSFTVRGWCVTVVSAMIALAVDGHSVGLALTALLPITVFWISDAYYLVQERAFRALYNRVRTLAADKIDFVMDPSDLQKETFLSVMFRPILLVLYGGLVVSVAAIASILCKN